MREDECQPSHRRGEWRRGAAALFIAGSCVVLAGVSVAPWLPDVVGGSEHWRVSLSSAGTGADVWQQLEVDAGTYKKDAEMKRDAGQLNLRVGDHLMSRSEYGSFGVRGSAMGSVKSPHVSQLIEKAATDCGQDPKCVCDWAGQPRECLFSYCCGTVIQPYPHFAPSPRFATFAVSRPRCRGEADGDGDRPQIAHKLGQRRGDYVNENPSPQQRVDAYQQVFSHLFSAGVF